MNRLRIISPYLLPAFLFAAFLLTLAGSISHVAWLYGQLEPTADTWQGIIIAVGLDSVIGAVTMAQILCRHHNQPIHPAMLMLLAMLVLVSSAANYLHADGFNHLAAGGWLRIATNLLGALPLPVSQLLYVEVAVAALPKRPPQPASATLPVVPTATRILAPATVMADVEQPAKAKVQRTTKPKATKSAPLTSTERSRQSRARQRAAATETT